MNQKTSERGSILVFTILLVLVVISGFLIYLFMQKYLGNKTPSDPVYTQSREEKTGTQSSSLDQDLGVLDNDIKSLDNDLIEVDSSLNDKMGDLSEQ